MVSGADPLKDEILAEIRAQGPISFSRFQALALYHPSWGYYTSGRAPGRDGADFWTAPEIDPAFGELVGRQVRQMARLLEAEGAFQVVEAGEPLAFDATAAQEWLSNAQEVVLEADLNRGQAEAKVWTCDFSYKYVEKNIGATQKIIYELGRLKKER